MINIFINIKQNLQIEKPQKNILINLFLKLVLMQKPSIQWIKSKIMNI